jgi:hypothetical protein
MPRCFASQLNINTLEMSISNKNIIWEFLEIRLLPKKRTHGKKLDIPDYVRNQKPRIKSCEKTENGGCW